MDHLVTALKSLAIPVVSKGTCDLTLNDRKFSGNSLRCKKKHLLYHGTLLYDYELSKIQRYLDTPPRQPEYRLNRTHEDFVINLPCTRSQLEKSLLESCWTSTDQVRFTRMASPPLKLYWDKPCRMRKSDRPFAASSPKFVFETDDWISNRPLPLVLRTASISRDRWMCM